MKDNDQYIQVRRGTRVTNTIIVVAMVILGYAALNFLLR